MNTREALTVSQLNEYMKALVDGDEFLGAVAVRGELSNYKIYPSGHHYFTLKDAESSLKCVMFRSAAGKLRFRPESGMGVTAYGRIGVYPRDGAYQLYCEAIVPEGFGDLQIAYEQLKARLEKEGLFAREHKKPIPRYPERIAVITSSAGAAVHDIIRVLRRRWPLGKIILLPVRVQGVEAPGEIAAALRYASAHKIADVVITGRGGGSIEDLWAFNDERVARAIYDCEIPVISAVGHEPDVTIADFVADLRAATPSNAAELAAPDSAELMQAIDTAMRRMSNAVTKPVSGRLSSPWPRARCCNPRPVSLTSAARRLRRSARALNPPPVSCRRTETSSLCSKAGWIQQSTPACLHKRTGLSALRPSLTRSARSRCCRAATP